MRTSTSVAIRMARTNVAGLGLVVLAAIGLGALISRLAPAGHAVAVAFGSTVSAALVGGLAAGPALYRRTHRPPIGVMPEEPADDGGAARVG
jgi:hypothetical protein